MIGSWRLGGIAWPIRQRIVVGDLADTTAAVPITRALTVIWRLLLMMITVARRATTIVLLGRGLRLLAVIPIVIGGAVLAIDVIVVGVVLLCIRRLIRIRRGTRSCVIFVLVIVFLLQRLLLLLGQCQAATA